jgi:hypothetical protein
VRAAIRRAKAGGPGRTHPRLGLVDVVQVKYPAVDLAPRLPKVCWLGMIRKPFGG